MFPRRFKYLQPSAYSRRSSAFIDRDFQLRYARSILIAATITSLVFLVPAYLLGNQNYKIFFDLADLLNPALAKYIHKERVAFNIVFIAAFFANTFFWTVFSHKMTAKIAAPAKLLRNHIRILCRGDFSQKPLKVRETDEFRDLISAYNYLYTLIRVQNERDLKDLTEVRKATKNPAIIEALERMIAAKKMRLEPRAGAGDLSRSDSQFNPLIDEAGGQDPDSRHAS